MDMAVFSLSIPNGKLDSAFVGRHDWIAYVRWERRRALAIRGFYFFRVSIDSGAVDVSTGGQGERSHFHNA
jgi:hypothetical protein